MTQRTWISLTLMLAAIGSGGCFGPGSTHTGPPADPKVLATLKRTGCMGWCAIYTVVVYQDGTVSWDGKGYVKTLGPATATLSMEQLAVLRQAFDDADFFGRSRDYACTEWTDMPSAYLSFNDGAREKTIDHYLGCESTRGVKELAKLENQFDEIVGTAKWIGTDEERRNQQPGRPMRKPKVINFAADAGTP